jgi:hypothetical protein
VEVPDPYDEDEAPPEDPAAAAGAAKPEQLRPGDNTLFGTKGSKGMSIPGNIGVVIEDVARRTGVPSKYLAGVLHQKFNNRWTKITDQDLVSTARKMLAKYKTYLAGRDPHEALGYAGTAGPRDEFGGPSPFDLTVNGDPINDVNDRMLWLHAAADIGSGAEQLSPQWTDYRNNIERFTKVAAVQAPDATFTAGKQPVIPGLSDRTAASVQRIADNLFIEYFGRYPEDDEYRWIVNSGLMNTDRLESWLRIQPYGEGFTLGDYHDIRDAMESAFTKILRRRATPEEIHFALVNHIPPGDADALAEQTRDHTVWGTDPDSYRERRSELQQMWNGLGLKGKVDANLVNNAITGGWSDEEIMDKLADQQAPGFPDGFHIGEVKRIRDVATQWKNHYFPGERLTEDEIRLFQGKDGQAMRAYYRSLPARPRDNSVVQGAVPEKQKAPEPQPQGATP